MAGSGRRGGSTRKSLWWLRQRAPFKLIRNRVERHPIRIFLYKASELGADVILDVGANVGQFASETFARGWSGTVISFEPIERCHRELCERAKLNPKWTVMDPMCVGSSEATATFLESANTVSSSLLRVTKRSTSVVDASSQVTETEVKVRPLDALQLPPTKLALKLDVQGYELEVLRGATATLDRVSTVLIEMSLARLYEDAPSVAEIFSHLESHGFRCISLTEGFSDKVHHEVLQVDGCFVKD